MWPLSWFKKKDDPEDYESILATLAHNISSKQTNLSEIRLRERRTTLVVTLYAIAGWLIYVGLWWTVLPRVKLWKYHSRDDRTVQNILKALPAVVGPILILFIRRIVQWWYTRKGDQEEKQLKSLMAEQRTKIEEIKKKTNYYSTKNLLDRYDESAVRKPTGPGGTLPELRHRQPHGTNSNGTPRGTPTPPVLPNGSQQAAPPGKVIPPQQLFQLTSPQPMAPPRKQWYDKVADALLGEDEASSGALHSRYALICEGCFAHNGLVRESQWDDMKYICPKCGHFNPSPRMKREHPEEYERSRAPSRAAGRESLGVQNGSFSPPISPTLSGFGSTANSPEPYRSRFSEGGKSPLGMRDASTEGSRGRSASRGDGEKERDGSPMNVDEGT